MKLLVPGLIVLLLVSACSKRHDPGHASTQAEPPATGSPPSASSVPAVGGDLIEVSGEELLLAVRELGGKGTVVNAWASWCGPCRREVPMLLGLTENLGSRGIEVLLVSVDEPEQRPRAVEFLKAHDASLPSFVARRPLGPFKVALNPRWPGMLPATFLYDASGRLRYFWGGPVYEDELLGVLDQFLAGTLVDGEAHFGLRPGKVER